MTSTSVAIVTGAGNPGGIGFAAARELGRDGRLVVISSTTPRIHQRVAELRDVGIDAHGFVADLTVPNQVQGLVDFSTARGEIATLVNNAGMTSISDPPAEDRVEPLEGWSSSLARNATTSFLMISHTTAALGRGGRIVNIASTSGPVMAYRGDIGYHAAKAAVIGMTRAFALELAPRDITVNAVAPGWIDTPSATDHERRQGLATPLGRSGTPREVAAVIGFLASESAAYITGQILVVDGGNSIDEERAARLP